MHRIIYLIDGLSMGGAERLMTHILPHMRSDSFDPRVCVLQQKNGNPVGQDIQRSGIPVDYLPVRRIRDVSAIPRLVRYLRQTGADLVHTQLEFSNVIGTLAARLVDIPSVSTIHVLPAVEERLKKNLHHKLEAFVLRSFADRVIAVAENARLAHIEATGAAPAQVVTVYNGIDLSTYENLDRSEVRQSARQELGIPPEARVLATVCVLRPEKGVEYMLRAMPAIVEQDPLAYYMVVGDGPRREALLEEADRDGLRGRVVFTGMRDDVPRLLAASDIFVLPSLTEALPTVLIEAMGAHLPLVASDVGGVAEMIDEGVNGYIVQPQDPEALAAACSRLLAYAPARYEMGEAGWRIARQKFSIQVQISRLQEIYAQEIEGNGK